MNELMQQENSNFDFENNGIEVMNLDMLMRTHKENDVYGNPVRGLHHFQVISQALELCDKHNLNYEIEEIFAAQNRNKTQPGVVLLPQIEQMHGDKAIEAHILRRIYTTIQIKDGETDEFTTNLVIAYHQEGVQIAIGPCVKICHNQCVLSPERSVSNYGKDRVSLDQMFVVVDCWLANFDNAMKEDRDTIARLKETPMSPKDVYGTVGLLTAYRVAHDSSDKNVSAMVTTYPLNQGQISLFTEDVLKLQQRQSRITAWDLYNVATEIYKPGRTDFPSIIPQNTAFVEMINTYKTVA